MITINKEKKLLAVLCIQTVLTVMSDTFFVSTLPFSLELGVNGIAYGNIMVNVLLLFILIRYLINEGLNIFSVRKLGFNWMKEWLTVGGYSGLESFVRNFAFMVMVLRMVNVVGEQGVSWVANNFIWMWLLLPVLQLGKVIKRDCGEFSNKAVSEKTVGYVLVTTFIIALWVISIPVWRIFIKEIMNSAEYMKVFHIALISLGFYIIFAYNNVIDT